MQLNAECFGDIRMWHYEDDKGASIHYLPGPIPWKRVGKGRRLRQLQRLHKHSSTLLSGTTIRKEHCASK